MVNGWFRFRVGAFDCLSLSDGRMTYPPETLFANVPQAEAAAAERAFWLSEAADTAPPMMRQVAREKFAAMENRLTLVDDGDEVVSGIAVVGTPGHTPGHLALAIGTGGDQLLQVSDAVLFPLHLSHPEWRPVFDMDPARADASRRRIFDRAAESGSLVCAHHFPPFPSVAHVQRSGAGWHWEPLAVERGW